MVVDFWASVEGNGHKRADASSPPTRAMPCPCTAVT